MALRKLSLAVTQRVNIPVGTREAPSSIQAFIARGTAWHRHSNITSTFTRRVEHYWERQKTGTKEHMDIHGLPDLSLFWVSLKAELFWFSSAAQTHHFHHQLELWRGCVDYVRVWQQNGKLEDAESTLVNHIPIPSAFSSQPALPCSCRCVYRVSISSLGNTSKRLSGYRGSGTLSIHSL